MEGFNMERSFKISFSLVIFLAVWTLASPCVAAEKFPAKAITVLAGTTPGATVDVSFRALMEPTSKILGQPILLVNKPGGGGSVMLNGLYITKPDCYTLGVLASGYISNAHLFKVPYHPVEDFDPILQYTVPQFGLVVRPDSPFKTLKDLITYAKANPKKIKYSTSGVGYPNHLVMMQLEEEANVKWTHVPFEGGQESMVALLGGHVDCSSQTSALKPFVMAGRARLLATYGEKRNPSFPDVPTLIEQGYNVVALSYYFIIGPKGLPKDRVKILHDAFYEGLQKPEVKKTFEQVDMAVSYRNSEDSKKAMMEIYQRSGKILQKIGKK